MIKKIMIITIIGGALFTSSLQAQARCGFFAGILKNQQHLPVRTMGDKRGGGGLDLFVSNGRTSKNYGICDADYFWAPKRTYGYTYYSHRKIRQYVKNLRVKMSAFTTTCKKLDSRDITCSNIWWNITHLY